MVLLQLTLLPKEKDEELRVGNHLLQSNWLNVEPNVKLKPKRFRRRNSLLRILANALLQKNQKQPVQIKSILNDNKRFLPHIMV